MDAIAARETGKGNRALVAAIYILFVFALFELSARTVLALEFGASFLRPDEVILHYYPELAEIETSLAADGADRPYRVLLLGASVLADSFGHIADRLRSDLGDKLDREVKVYNAAVPAHTTLDSLYKYRYLRDADFDLILVYHGINETRANNCPPDFFQEDYAHYSWYGEVNLIEAHPELRFTALPYAFALLGRRVQEQLGQIEILPQEPPAAWRAHGEAVKTREPFRRNLEAIVELAQSRGQRPLLMTFAHYVPEDYTRKLFRYKALDYSFHPISAPIELWGKPELVVRALDIHNEIVRDVARRHPTAIFIDQEAQIPDAGTYYRDICHFSESGMARFVDNIARTLEDAR